ncbi:MAG: hypothetical protein HC831_26725, partial [Chloroflexia bacterium]|nr:hypothetical protein [Chloroflexia bacterium]
FRMAYDQLLSSHAPKVADKLYLKLLELAAHESQDAVQDALRVKLQAGESIDVAAIRALVLKAAEIPPATEVAVELPPLCEFDCLLENPLMESSLDDQDPGQNFLCLVTILNIPYYIPQKIPLRLYKHIDYLQYVVHLCISYQ